MKKLIFTAFIGLNLATFTQASEANIVDKIVQCQNILADGVVDFSATKNGDGYDITIKPENKIYNTILNKDAKIHLSVDEGPLITSPSFSFGKAGLKGSGDILDILSKDVVKDIKKNLKTGIKYSYEGKVGFGGDLESKTVIDGLYIDNNDTTFKTSKIDIVGNMNIDSCIGKSTISMQNLEVKPKKEEGIFKVKNLTIASKLTNKPIENIALFAKTYFKADEVAFKAKDGNRSIDTKFSLAIEAEAKKVNDNFTNIQMVIATKALNAQTIALAQGIKESKIDFAIENAGTKGILGLVKFSKEMEKAQDKMLEASQKGDDVAMQKAILAMNELTNSKMVPIYNQLMVKDKTKIKLYTEIFGDKKSFIKLDLLYKASPVSGNMQSAMITLAAQNLAIADGTFEVQLDSSMASTLYPMSTLVLDMLKQKGFATMKNGIYHLKGELKGGKVIINGKAYTIQELGRVMF